MHLHTYHINTDKAACAKQARQTAAVNFTARPSAVLDGNRARETNVFFMEDMLEHGGEQTRTEN